ELGTCRFGPSATCMQRFAQHRHENTYDDEKAETDLMLQVGCEKREVRFNEEVVAQYCTGDKRQQRRTEPGVPCREHDCRVISRERRHLLKNRVQPLSQQSCQRRGKNSRAITYQKGAPALGNQQVHALILQDPGRLAAGYREWKHVRGVTSHYHSSDSLLASHPPPGFKFGIPS